MKRCLNGFQMAGIAAALAAVSLLVPVTRCAAQLVVENKNITEDKTIHYIQLIYYVEKKSLKPVYMVDYGLNNAENINLNPRIRLDGESLLELSPVAILNRLYGAGWEYLGDYNYIQRPGLPMHIYTLKRKDDSGIVGASRD